MGRTRSGSTCQEARKANLYEPRVGTHPEAIVAGVCMCEIAVPPEKSPLSSIITCEH